MSTTKIGSAIFKEPDMVRVDWHSFRFYKPLKDDTCAVYILRGNNNEVLYVGFSDQLKKRLTAHLYGRFKSEIKLIEYITDDKMNGMGLRELEKILYFLLKPKYCRKKIVPATMYKMKRIK